MFSPDVHERPTKSRLGTYLSIGCLALGGGAAYGAHGITESLRNHAPSRSGECVASVISSTMRIEDTPADSLGEVGVKTPIVLLRRELQIKTCS
ncbi:MAG: hypothetical protein WA843_01000 [Candidatus Saccharimonadales bacterium]